MSNHNEHSRVNLHLETSGINLLNDPDRDQVSRDLVSQLDWIQGRLLSDEILLHFITYMKDNNSPETAVRAFETWLDSQDKSVDNGIIFSFIPKTLSELNYETMCNTHSIVPISILYEKGFGILDGARIFIYNSNAPDSENESIQLFDDNGILKFSYSQGGNTYSSDNGYQLAFSMTDIGNESKKLSVPFSVTKLFGLGIIGL
jgi:hypothetical protein